MSDIKNRSDIPQEMCWDLTYIYKNESDWEADFKSLDSLLDDFLAFKGRLADSPETLKAAFEASDKLGIIMERLCVYSHLKNDEDTSNAVNAGRHDRISAKSAEIGGESAWFDPELLAIDKEKFDILRNSPVLAFYKRTLDDTERERAHTLSAAEERIIEMSSDVFGSSEKSFSMFNDADLRFPEIEDEKGVKVELTHANYIPFLESSERRVRCDAFNALYDTYASFKNTAASFIDGTVKANALQARLHNFDSTRECALFVDNIPLNVYDSLVETVNMNLPSLHRYFDLRAKKLGFDKIEMYDIMNPLVPAANVKFTWPESVSAVKEACRVLGSEYSEVLERAFNERWIDIAECRGKRSGAYSSGCYRKPPYMLLNHTGTLDSVFTLAHELGHSLHSYFSDQACDYHYASYRIFAAEVASTTNELLLHRHLMNEAKSDDFKAYLLNHLIDTMRGTIFRQTMFAEFERDIYAMSEDGEPLTHETLSDRYYELNKKYHGSSVAENDKIRYEWERIPHFHYCFYVYKYATGMSAASKLAQDILEGNTERYLAFLRAGDTKDVIDIMKDAGVDFSSDAVVKSAMKLFDDSVTELDKLIS